MNKFIGIKAITTAVLWLLFMAPVAYAIEPETLLGVQLNYDKKEITIQVISTGCTLKSDFKFEFTDGKLTVSRQKPDLCKAMPEVVSFTYSAKEAGIDVNKPFTISNKFIINPFLAGTGK
jgi:hypothetical protein